MRFNKMVRFLRSFLLLISISSFCDCSATEPSNWYYAWSNNFNNMEAASDDEIVPAVINGKNYRILKISNFSGSIFKNFTYKSATSTVEIYQLPLMQDHNSKKIFDLVLPIKAGEAFYDSTPDKYFLVIFKGTEAGQENVKLTIASDKKIYNYSKQIKTSSKIYKSPINLNVFAYFDYNFLVKDLKTQVINDLEKHNNNVLVIPPSALPNLSQGNFDNTALRNYLKGTENKFKYYILYFNFNDNKIDLNNTSLKKNIPEWYKRMMQVFEENKISINNVLLFPYDEPKNEQISKLTALYDHFRAIGIQNPFFVTIDERQAGKEVINKIEFIQMQPETMKDFNTSNTKSQLWTYQLIYGSRDRLATEYRNMSITAFRNNAKGIGVWSYADIDRAIDSKGKSQFSKGVGSWNINYSAPSAEYALIYRRNNVIYPSLRWEALSYGMEDYFWLQLHKNKFGIDQNKEILNKIDKFSEKERDALKLKILK